MAQGQQKSFDRPEMGLKYAIPVKKRVFTHCFVR